MAQPQKAPHPREALVNLLEAHHEATGELYNIARLAEELHMDPTSVKLFLEEKLPVDEQLATRLELLFPATPAYFWLMLQAQYDESQHDSGQHAL